MKALHKIIAWCAALINLAWLILLFVPNFSDLTKLAALTYGEAGGFFESLVSPTFALVLSSASALVCIVCVFTKNKLIWPSVVCHAFLIIVALIFTSIDQAVSTSIIVHLVLLVLLLALALVRTLTTKEEPESPTALPEVPSDTQEE